MWRTAVLWMTQPPESTLSNPYGRLFRCLSVKLGVRHHSCTIIYTMLTLIRPAGFIPVLYSYLRSRNTAAPLLSNDEDDAAPKPSGTKLKGSKIFLFWLPAACDLAGTTVSLTPISGTTSRAHSHTTHS